MVPSEGSNGSHRAPLPLTMSADLEASALGHLLGEAVQPLPLPRTTTSASGGEAPRGGGDTALLPSPYRQHLLKIHRDVDQASHPRNRFHWLRPWTWFGSGPQVSPLVWEWEGSPPTTTTTTLPPGPIMTTTTTTTTIATEEEEEGEMARRGDRYRREGLPAVSMTPLSSAVVSALHPDVTAKRAEVLAGEEKIHQALQRIETARRYYLSTAADVTQPWRCESAVKRVTQCLHRANTSASARKAAFRTEQAALAARAVASNTSPAVFKTAGAHPETSPAVLHPWWLHAAPVVAFDALECGPAVEALQTCTREMLARYTVEDVA